MGSLEAADSAGIEGIMNPDRTSPIQTIRRNFLTVKFPPNKRAFRLPAQSRFGVGRGPAREWRSVMTDCLYLCNIS